MGLICSCIRDDRLEGLGPSCSTSLGFYSCCLFARANGCACERAQKPTGNAGMCAKVLRCRAEVHITAISVDSRHPDLTKIDFPCTSKYQNHDFGRFPIFYIYDSIMGTCKHDGYGSPPCSPLYVHCICYAARQSLQAKTRKPDLRRSPRREGRRSCRRSSPPCRSS